MGQGTKTNTDTPHLDFFTIGCDHDTAVDGVSNIKYVKNTSLCHRSHFGSTYPSRADAATQAFFFNLVRSILAQLRCVPVSPEPPRKGPVAVALPSSPPPPHSLALDFGSILGRPEVEKK